MDPSVPWRDGEALVNGGKLGERFSWLGRESVKGLRLCRVARGRWQCGRRTVKGRLSEVPAPGPGQMNSQVCMFPLLHYTPRSG